MTETLSCDVCSKRIGVIVGGDLNCGSIFCVECAEEATKEADDAARLNAENLRRLAYGKDEQFAVAPDVKQ